MDFTLYIERKAQLCCFVCLRNDLWYDLPNNINHYSPKVNKWNTLLTVMHLQFPLKQCWKKNNKTNGAKYFKILADNATLEELSELKKNNTFLERVYSFAANSVKRLTSDVAERDRQILALQQKIRALHNQPGVPLASRWFYCIFIFIADDTRVTKLMFFVWIYWLAVSTEFQNLWQHENFVIF